MKLFKLISVTIFICFISIHVSAFSKEATHQSHLDHMNTSLNTGQELTIIPSSMVLFPSTLKFIVIFLCGCMFGGAIGLFAGGIIAGGSSFGTTYDCDKGEVLTS